MDMKHLKMPVVLKKKKETIGFSLRTLLEGLSGCLVRLIRDINTQAVSKLAVGKRRDGKLLFVSFTAYFLNKKVLLVCCQLL